MKASRARLADREHAVIVHDHGAVAAEMRNDALALAEILGDALVGVIADAAVEAHRLLREHAQPALEAGDAPSRSGCGRAPRNSRPAARAARRRAA